MSEEEKKIIFNAAGQLIILHFNDLISEIAAQRSTDRTERDRHISILITELEKIRAFAKDTLL